MSEMRNAADLQVEYEARERLRDAAPELMEALRIGELLQTVGYNRAAAEQIGDEARTVYAMHGSFGLRKYADDKRRAAIAKAIKGPTP